MSLGGRPAAPGDVIAGRYRVESWLGQGNMAAVFRATHLGTGQPCAVKLVHPHLVERAEIRDLFVQEARVGARIGKNPYVVDVFDAGIDPQRDVPYLAMELLDGDTLDRYVKKRGPVPPGLLKMLFLQLADALGQAHAAGVVHRDLKPGNLFLTYDRRKAPLLKVVDFGIAKVVEDAAQGTATQVGSPAYSAPEQLGQAMRPMAETLGIVIARSVSAQTDIWALGVIAYELLLGAPPGHLWIGSERGSIADIMMGAAINPTPTVLSRAGFKVHLFPRGFDEWLDRCLKKNAIERWPRVEDAVRSLAELLDQGYEDGETLRALPRDLLDFPMKSPTRAAVLAAGATWSAGRDSAETAPLPGVVASERIARDAPPANPVVDAPSERKAQTRTPPLIPASAAPLRPSAPSVPDMLDVPPANAVVEVPRRRSAQTRTLPLVEPPVVEPRPPAPSAPNVVDGAIVQESPIPSAFEPGSTPRPAAETKHDMAGTTPPTKGAGSRLGATAALALSVVGMVMIAIFAFLPKTGKLRIVPEGGGETAAEVFIDGQKRCDFLPCVVEGLAPGGRIVNVLSSGAAATGPIEADVARGEEKALTVRIVGGSKKGKAARLKIAGRPEGAKVLIDGKAQGTLPINADGLLPGSHVLRIEGNERFNAFERTIELADGTETDLGRIDLSVRRGLLKLELATPGAGVTLTNHLGKQRQIPSEQWIRPPVTIEIDPSDAWRIIAKKTGFAYFEQVISFEDGVAEKSITISLTSSSTTGAGTPAKQGPAFLNINSIPVSKAVLDGIPIGGTPKVGVEVTPGSHTVLFIHPERGSQTQTVSISAGETKTVAIKFQ